MSDIDEAVMAAREWLEQHERQVREAATADDGGYITYPSLPKCESFARALLALHARAAWTEAVVEAAQRWASHECIDGDSNCYAGDHDDCGLREKRLALEAAVALNTLAAGDGT